MDIERNPLNTMSPVQILSGISLLYLKRTALVRSAPSIWFGQGALITTHVLLVLGFAITVITLCATRKAPTYSDHAESGGPVRYGDVWCT